MPFLCGMPHKNGEKWVPRPEGGGRGMLEGYRYIVSVGAILAPLQGDNPIIPAR